MNDDREAAIRRDGWQAAHARNYIRSNGEKGHIWQGVPTLLLTTTGRKSGNPYLTPLIYGKDGDRYLIVASVGGGPKHPQWYLNLAANPTVELQVGSERFTATARTATAEEKPPLWDTMVKIWPSYTGYQQKTSRDIPVVILERA